ncbi:MAG: methionine adenosyltransferase [Thaumarchaeota archaeon]|nr:methionine adenosyltransferase [Nitrososphaerota archaeon]MDE0525489.1 methionine adenosyltransferase [Nitrososphaerota archaeon]
MSDSENFLFTSESVTEGHPDKICDNVSDAFLDEYLRQDPDSRVAIEALVTTDFVMVSGEVTSKAALDKPAQERLARTVIREIGYDDADLKFDADTCEVRLMLHSQSPDISRGVDEKEGGEQGAGDQGIMFGYATNETPEMMPMPILLSHKLTRMLSQVRRDGTLPWVRPDGKSQVSVRYEGGSPAGITAVVISTQHAPDVSQQDIREGIISRVIRPVLGDMWDDGIRVHVNPTGRFEIGGPHGDTGLTGRKIIVDTYGGFGRHGGGAFSGKDPSKVDRSACYMCRYIAKNVVAAGIADRCEVQLAYAIGVAEPVSLYVNTFGTGKVSDERITGIIRENFEMRPAAIISQLNLKRPIYRRTAAYGHFGRGDEPEFTWERTDRAGALRKAAGL